MDRQIKFLSNAENVTGVENKKQWTEHGTLRHPEEHGCYSWHRSTVSNVLPPASEVGPNPSNCHPRETEQFFKPIQENIVVHTVESCTEVKIPRSISLPWSAASNTFDITISKAVCRMVSSIGELMRLFVCKWTNILSLVHRSRTLEMKGRFEIGL